MSAWTDARDNIREGLAAMWDGFPATVKAGIISFVCGIVLGAAMMGLFLC